MIAIAEQLAAICTTSPAGFNRSTSMAGKADSANMSGCKSRWRSVVVRLLAVRLANSNRAVLG